MPIVYRFVFYGSLQGVPHDRDKTFLVSHSQQEQVADNAIPHQGREQRVGIEKRRVATAQLF